MADVDDVRDILRSLGTIDVEADGDSFSVSRGRVTFSIEEADVDAYLNIRGGAALDPETSMYSPGHYEHLVDVLTPGPMPGLRLLMRRDEDSIQLESQDRKITAEVSGASNLFALAVLDSLDVRRIRRFQFILRPPFRLRERDGDGADLTLSDLFSRITTITVNADPTSPHHSNLSQLRHIADSCLFNLSATRSISLVLSDSWERSHYRMRGGRGQATQFPRKKYDRSLVAHYQLALSSDSLVLAYLSLYKIIEFFYTSTAESTLHSQLRDRLEQPSFHYSRADQLRKIASIVRKFDQRYNEQKKLSLVLDHHFDVDEIPEWIRQYEATSGTYYTVPNDVLGLEHSVDLNPDQVASSLAQRIYHIRNGLVHNQENELSRFVPFTGNEDVLLNELPVLRFLAERLIVRTGTLI